MGFVPSRDTLKALQHKSGRCAIQPPSRLQRSGENQNLTTAYFQIAVPSAALISADHAAVILSVTALGIGT